MALSLAERQAFLAEPHVAALSVGAEHGRAPLTVPIWYDYTPGGELWLITGRDSQKARRIEATGRCTLMVDRVAPTVRYVSVEGPARLVGPAGSAEERHLAERYLPPEAVEPYLASAEEHGPSVRVVVTPEHWLSADLGGF